MVFSEPRGLFAGGAWMLNTTTLTLVTQRAIAQDVPVVVYVISASGITLPAAGLLLDDPSFLVAFGASAGPVAPPIPIGRTRIVPRTATAGAPTPGARTFARAPALRYSPARIDAPAQANLFTRVPKSHTQTQNPRQTPPPQP